MCRRYESDSDDDSECDDEMPSLVPRRLLDDDSDDEVPDLSSGDEFSDDSDSGSDSDDDVPVRPPFQERMSGLRAVVDSPMFAPRLRGGGGDSDEDEEAARPAKQTKVAAVTPSKGEHSSHSSHSSSPAEEVIDDNDDYVINSNSGSNANIDSTEDTKSNGTNSEDEDSGKGADDETNSEDEEDTNRYCHRQHLADSPQRPRQPPQPPSPQAAAAADQDGSDGNAPDKDVSQDQLFTILVDIMEGLDETSKDVDLLVEDMDRCPGAAKKFLETAFGRTLPDSVHSCHSDILKNMILKMHMPAQLQPPPLESGLSTQQISFLIPEDVSKLTKLVFVKYHSLLQVCPKLTSCSL